MYNGFNYQYGTYNPSNNYGYGVPPLQQTQMQNTNLIPNTNIIYVNGLEDVKNRQQPANSVYLYRDNDKQIVYERTVDAKGQFEVKAYSLTVIDTKQAQNNESEKQTINPSDYVLKTDFEALQGQIKGLETKMKKMLVNIEMQNIDKEEK
jgi:hypothetical protein